MLGLIAGFGIGFTVADLYAVEEQHYQTVSANANSSNYGKRPEQYLTPRSGIPASVESAISNPQPATGQDHEKRDLAAQEASATFAWWMVVVSTLGFAVTTIGTILHYKQIKLTQEAVQDTGKATEAMQRQNEIAEAAQRPWIKLDIEPVGIGFRSGNRGIEVDIQLRNIGTSAARDSEFWRGYAASFFSITEALTVPVRIDAAR